MNIFNDHRKLYPIAGALFIFLTCLVVILPAFQNQKNNAPFPGSKPLTGDALAGKMVYIAEGCVACHSQQVRNVDMDKAFGSRPGMASDYANMGRTSIWQNTATLMGTERTGPDLTDVGNRQGSLDWNLMHLYNPRAVVPQSIMPAYGWLFSIKEKAEKGDVVVNVPAEFMDGQNGVVVASRKALQLVAYLQSLKQIPLPNGTAPLEFLYKKEKAAGATGAATPDLEGKTLYGANCQSCHQENGEGLKGAFPPLKGSPIVSGKNLELYVDIIMNGFDARPEFGVMPGVGTALEWNEKQVAAIINYERTAWGNNGEQVNVEEIKKIMDMIKAKKANP